MKGAWRLAPHLLAQLAGRLEASSSSSTFRSRNRTSSFARRHDQNKHDSNAVEWNPRAAGGMTGLLPSQQHLSAAWRLLSSKRLRKT